MTLTWQEAKSQTQAFEKELIALFPPDNVRSVEQKDKGYLLSCSKTEHSWNGVVRVYLRENVDAESSIRAVAEHYRDSRFRLNEHHDVAGDYSLQLIDDEAGDSYLLSIFGADWIDISSSSPCFTLPEGIYPGGNF